MLEAVFHTNNLESKLSVLSSGLGNIFNELLQEVGNELAADVKAQAPVRTGKLRDSINFTVDKKSTGILSTRKSLRKSNVFYSNMVEHGHKASAKSDTGYLTFKINGEWKKVKSVTVAPRPFAKPLFENYFDEGQAGFRKLQEALMRKVEEELQ